MSFLFDLLLGDLQKNKTVFFITGDKLYLLNMKDRQDL